MSRSKKIFAVLALAFFFMLVYVAYDISSRTTFPGQKSTNDAPTDPPSAADSITEDSSRRDSI